MMNRETNDYHNYSLEGEKNPYSENAGLDYSGCLSQYLPIYVYIHLSCIVYTENNEEMTTRAATLNQLDSLQFLID